MANQHDGDANSGSGQQSPDSSISPMNLDSSAPYSSHHQNGKIVNDTYQGNTTDSADQKSELNFENNPDAMNAAPGVGHILRNARIAKGMSIEDVSRQLRLSTQQIDAIERENFEKLPGRTFLRGFIRNYASLVQLDPLPLLKMLPESVRIISTPENTPLRGKQISFSSNRKKTRNYSLPIVVIMAIFILGAYFLLGNQNQQYNQDVELNVAKEASKSELGSTTKEIQLSIPVTPKDSGSDTVSNRQIESENTNSTSVEVKLDLKSALKATESKPAAQASEVAAALPVDPNTGHLQFKFNADSWIKVIDGGGANLLEQVKKAGSEHTVTGKKPFTIILGNASAVNLTYNDQEIDVSSYKNQGGTARFTLE